MITAHQQKQLETLQAIAEQGKVDTHGPSPILLGPDDLLDLLSLVRQVNLFHCLTLKRVESLANEWVSSGDISIVACGQRLLALLRELKGFEVSPKENSPEALPQG